jgi:uncharacterized membrane protein
MRIYPIKDLTSAIWIIIFFASCVIALIQPPFQTPDEFNHLKRAFLLSEGKISFDNQNSVTGGNVDSGLLEFMSCYESIPYHHEIKISNEIIQKCKKISWSSETQFSPLPNTAVYFPAIYTPQAFFIKISKLFNMSLYKSYMFIKFGCILITFLLLFYANSIHRISEIGIAFLSMPMSLFLIGSTHPESLSYGLALIVTALFIRNYSDSKKYSTTSIIFMLCILFILATYRIYLGPLFLLPLFLIFKMKDYRLSFYFLITILLTVYWILFASSHVSGFDNWASSGLNPVVDFSIDISRICSVFFNTITNPEIIGSYFKSFVGVLGWLDSPLESYQYAIISILILLIIAIHLLITKNTYLNLPNAIIFTAAVSSFLLIFLLLLFTATNKSSLVIEGLQGRYFIPIVLFSSYIFLNLTDNKKIISHTLIIFLIVSSSLFTLNNITERYYLSNKWSGDGKYITGNLYANTHYGFLDKGRTFEQPFIAETNYLDAIRLKLATFRINNYGGLTLEIIDSNKNIIFTKHDDLINVIDNDWFYADTNMLFLKKGYEYRIRLSASPDQAKKSITWWSINDNKKLKGKIFVDGKERNGSFVYELLYRYKK